MCIRDRGTAVSEMSSQIFREIERTIRTYEREKQAERSQNYDGAELHEERRVPDSGHPVVGAGTEAAGQVRENAQLSLIHISAYSVEIWKRFRKWGGIPTGITQNVKDLLSSREVTNIFENSDFIYMLNQAAGDRQILADQLNISPHQLSYVTHSGEGEGLQGHSAGR